MEKAATEKIHWVKPSTQGVELYNEESSSNQSIFLRIINFFFDFLQSIALGGAFFVVFYLFIVQPHQVKGSSMYPTFKDKEYILTDKITYKFSLPKRGDVIILMSPKNPDVDYIKRVVGLPGERVRITDGKVYINDLPLNEDFIKVETPIFPGGFIQENQEVIVNENNYFVLGDNRPGSSDSREFGLIPQDKIIGRVIFRYYPTDRFGPIENPKY